MLSLDAVTSKVMILFTFTSWDYPELSPTSLINTSLKGAVLSIFKVSIEKYHAYMLAIHTYLIISEILKHKDRKKTFTYSTYNWRVYRGQRVHGTSNCILLPLIHCRCPIVGFFTHAEVAERISEVV